MPSDPTTVPEALAAALRADPNAPLITYYDEQLGERTELSATTLDNWVAKTANLLVDGAGLGPDDSAAVALPAHWQAAAVLLGCLTAGVPIRLASTPPDSARPVSTLADSNPAGPDPTDSAQTDPNPADSNVRGHDAAGSVPADIAFATPDRVGQVAAFGPAETYLLGLAPMAMPLREVPDGAADYVVSVRAFGDRFSAAPGEPGDIGWYEPEPVSQAALAEQARRHAAEAGLLPGGRLLIPVDAEPSPVAWLFAPLVIGASVVLVRNAAADRLDQITATERITTRT